MSFKKAKALRQGLTKPCNLTPDFELQYTGNDWVIVLLDKLNKDIFGAWHHRNDIIF
jgi:hypothetical protein